MRNVVLYEHRLTSGNNISLTAGDHTLECSFIWPEAVQTQYDIVQRQIKDASNSDPILREDGSYDRTYDYLNYYSEIPAFGAGMEEWWAAQTEVPQSLRNLETPYTVLTQRKQLCSEMKEYLHDLEDQLVYQCVIIDESGYKTVMSVRTGAYCRWRDTSWSLRFTSALEQIGKDDLSKVTVEVLSYEFI